MSDWTISVVQLPIRLPGIGDTGFRHNTIVIRDGNGAFYRELNGGPVDANGNLIDFRNPVAQSTTAYTSGQYLVGVKDSSVAFYSAGLGSGTQVYSGSQEQVLARYDAALSCADEINALSRKYTLATGMILVDRDTNTTEPSFNSNSVAATVLECMGLNSNNPAFSNSTTPGSNNPILSQPAGKSQRKRFRVRLSHAQPRAFKLISAAAFGPSSQCDLSAPVSVAMMHCV